MNFLEKNLEDIIFETPSDKLRERGLYIHAKRKRQLKIGNYGIADIVTLGRGYTPNGIPYVEVQVLELKQDKVDVHTFFQAVRYIKGIQRWISEHHYSLELIRYKIDLVGKSIDLHSPVIYLADIINIDDFSIFGLDINIYTYSYEFDGIRFKNNHGYQLTNEGF